VIFKGDRLHCLIDVKHPLNDQLCLSASEEARFNLENKGSGPVAGFEQSRAYLGLGRHTDEAVRLELGFLWRYERERQGPDKSDQIIRFRLIVDTGRRD